MPVKFEKLIKFRVFFIANCTDFFQNQNCFPQKNQGGANISIFHNIFKTIEMKKVFFGKYLKI